MHQWKMYFDVIPKTVFQVLPCFKGGVAGEINFVYHKSQQNTFWGHVPLVYVLMYHLGVSHDCSPSDGSPQNGDTDYSDIYQCDGQFQWRGTA